MLSNDRELRQNTRIYAPTGKCRQKDETQVCWPRNDYKPRHTYLQNSYGLCHRGRSRCGEGKRLTILLLLLIIIIIIMYIYHAVINSLSAHMIYINLNMTFYTHVEHSSTKITHTKQDTEGQPHPAPTHTKNTMNLNMYDTDLYQTSYIIISSTAWRKGDGYPSKIPGAGHCRRLRPFIQSYLELVLAEGQVMLAEGSVIHRASNGRGGVHNNGAHGVAHGRQLH